MPIERLPYTPDCSKFKVITEGGQDTGLRMLNTFPGRKNVDLGGGNFAPYVWDEPSQSIRYGNLQCEFDVDGFQVIREYGFVETLIDEQQFEVQYWRTQGGGSWRVVDLYQVGLIVDDSHEEYCVITRTLSDGEVDGVTLDVDFLFRPYGKVKNTFRLHVVDTSLTYRIRFQNSGIAGEMVEVPAIDIKGQNFGIFKLLFENIKFQWDANEIDFHSYTVEDQAGGKKLDIFISDFVLDSNGDIVISPDQWGPISITDADDGMEIDDTTWYDDSSGYIAAGKSDNDIVDAGLMWIVTDVDLPGATINEGTKITIDITGVYFGGTDGVLKIVDNRSPGVWGQSNRPSQMTKHPDTVDCDIPSSGPYDSPELNSFVQQRIDGDDVADPFESGDKFTFVLEDVAGIYDQRSYWPEGNGDFTIIYTPAVSGVTVDCTLGTITINGENAAISAGTNIDSTLGAVSIVGLNLNISIGTDINVSLGEVNITGLNPGISVGIDIDATLGQINILGLGVDISEGINVDCSLGAVNIVGLNAGIDLGTVVNCTSGNINIAGLNPAVSIGTDIETGLGTVNITGFDADINLGVIIDVNTGSIVVDGKNANIEAGVAIDCSLGAINIAGLNPDVVSTVLVDVTLGQIDISGLNANVQIGELESSPIERTFMIPTENRTLDIEAENRTLLIEEENRTYII